MRTALIIFALLSGGALAATAATATTTSKGKTGKTEVRKTTPAKKTDDDDAPAVKKKTSSGSGGIGASSKSKSTARTPATSGSTSAAGTSTSKETPAGDSIPSTKTSPAASSTRDPDRPLKSTDPGPSPSALRDAGMPITKKATGASASTTRTSTSTADGPKKKSAEDAAVGTASAATSSSTSASETDPPVVDQEGGPSSQGKSTKSGKPERKAAAVSTMLPEELEGFENYSADLQQIVKKALELTTKNLRYQFGSADPDAGGMDCSGTVFRVLQDSGISGVPRQSDDICRWVMRRSQLYRTEDTTELKDKSLKALQPGDLLFWSGTYETSTPRELPISHVMLYLGKRKKDGKPVVFGASDGRTYNGERRNGVSVFDFVMPRRTGKAEFYGYGPIPGLKRVEVAASQKTQDEEKGL